MGGIFLTTFAGIGSWKSSLNHPQCQDCCLKWTDPNEVRMGCIGLEEVPQRACSFHKTPAEQEESLRYAYERNHGRALDALRVF